MWRTLTRRRLTAVRPSTAPSVTAVSYLTAIILISALALVEIQGKKFDSGPQVFNETTKVPPQSNQKRYATKEIILYLTPSQIKALEEGKGSISPQQIANADNIQHTIENGYAYGKQLVHDNAEEHLNQQLASAQPLQPTPIEEPRPNDFTSVIPPPEYLQTKNSYINIEPQHQPLVPKPIPFIPDPHSQIPFFPDPHSQSPALIQQEPLNGNIQESELNKDQLKEQWYRLLEQNRAHFRALDALHKYDIDRINQHNSDVLQYVQKYSDNKYGPDAEQQLKHQHALLQTAPIANSPPVVVRKEINIKHSPVHLIKQVKVPVPTPILIRIPEPFAVNVPQPYPVPLEIIKPVPVPIFKTQKIEAERPAPTEIEKFVPYSETRNFYAERPYFLDRVVPLQDPALKTGTFPIHSHIWNH